MENGNSAEVKVIRATSFGKKLIVKSFNFEKLVKIYEKKISSSIEGG